MKRTISTLLAGTATAALAATTLAVAPAQAANDTPPRAFALTSDGKLASFRIDKARQITVVAPVTGLAGDTKLVGIDFRPANRVLYGVGDQGGVYTLKKTSGVATKVSQLSVGLEGSAFGVDFNPAADRLRVISDTGQNLRHDVSPTGTTIVDLPLNTPPSGDPTQGITAAAYTNNDGSDTTGTLLFAIDTTLDRLVTQTPANNGTITPVGTLGRSVVTAGFDIHTTLSDGAAVSNTGWAALRAQGVTKLYRIDLSSGRSTLVSGFAGGSKVADIAVVPSK